MAIAYKSFVFGEVKFDRYSLPTPCIPLYYSETEKPTFVFTVIVFKMSRNSAKHCQPSLPM